MGLKNSSIMPRLSSSEPPRKGLFPKIKERVPYITRRLFLAEYSLLRFPWTANNEFEVLDKMRKLSLAQGRKCQARSDVFLSIFWPLQSLIASTIFLWKNGKDTKKICKISLRKQFKQSFLLSIRHNIPAEFYYELRAWQHYDNAHLYVHMYEHAFLCQWLNTGKNVKTIDDKLIFFEACVDRNVATVPIIACLNPEGPSNSPIVWYQDPVLPAEDLYFKPTGGKCGQGIQRWKYDLNAQQWRRGVLSLDQAELIAYQIKRSSRRSLSSPIVVQCRQRNHPDWAKFSEGSLCSLRVVTYYLSDSFEPKLLLTAFRMPVGDKAVDNLHAGGIAAGVDQNGVLGAARTLDVGGGIHTHHPGTGAVLEGATLPHYEDLVNLALSAHKAFREFKSVGWDLVLSESGPRILEGNLGWCTSIVQMANDKPLGSTDYPRIFVDHLCSLSQPK
ncbi:MAG: sugar-transfer associated ATP-grasp domain-containing protein [Cyanophyceae cyanobacterium]